MAQYKVPQDVEADDKLLGPFSFRQFVYLLIAGGLIALMVGLFQLFPLLAIIPLIPALFFIVLALPLKKDQPMETYLAALLSYYLKPHTRTWTPGQKDSTIQIIAPKIVEEKRVRDISSEEATHRLSFLADIVDTGGYAIKGITNNSMREDLAAEASMATDIFESGQFENLENKMEKDENLRHEEVMREMKEAIEKSENMSGAKIVLDTEKAENEKPVEEKKEEEKEERKEEKKVSSVVVQPEPLKKKDDSHKKDSQTLAKSSIMGLANNPDYSVATIAKEAERLKRKDEGEVFISLH